jgi:hypothetical protein
MLEVQGNSVRLYLEGLMFFAFDEKQNRLEAGILNIDDGHNLRVRTFSREYTKPGAGSDEVWEAKGEELISDTDLQLYEQGKITLLGPGGEPRDISSPLVPRNPESWMPFSLIPNIEDIIESKVKLNRSKVKPVLSITGGNFFSVLRPEHLEPLEKRADDREFIRTYRLEKDQVVMAKNQTCGKIESLEGLVEVGVAVKEFAIRAYTAATIITLNEDEELVCVLQGDQAEPRMLFRVRYAPDREAKVAIENAVAHSVSGSEEHSHHGAGESDPIRFFHFLHFYDAIKNRKRKETFFLTSEEKLVQFLESGSGIRVFTGADDPFCPSTRVPVGSLT